MPRGVARVWQSLVVVLPERVHPGRLDWWQGRRRAAGIDEFRAQWPGESPAPANPDQKKIQNKGLHKIFRGPITSLVAPDNLTAKL